MDLFIEINIWSVFWNLPWICLLILTFDLFIDINIWSVYWYQHLICLSQAGLLVVLALASSVVDAQKVIININGNWRSVLYVHWSHTICQSCLWRYGSILKSEKRTKNAAFYFCLFSLSMRTSSANLLRRIATSRANDMGKLFGYWEKYRWTH